MFRNQESQLSNLFAMGPTKTAQTERSILEIIKAEFLWFTTVHDHEFDFEENAP